MLTRIRTMVLMIVGQIHMRFSVRHASFPYKFAKVVSGDVHSMCVANTTICVLALPGLRPMPPTHGFRKIAKKSMVAS